MRVTIKMASGPETHWPLTREDPSFASDVGDSVVNHVLSTEVKDAAEDGRVDSLEQCYRDGCITTAKEQISDILERGSWSPSRHGSSSQETPSLEDGNSQDNRTDKTDECREGKRKPHFSSISKSRSQPVFVHSESSPILFKAGRRDTVSVFPANDSSISDELLEENAHFSISHALIGILEEYRVTVSEQQLDLEALRSFTPGNGLLASPGCVVTGDSQKGPYLENSCLFQSKPPAYGSAAHRSAHQMMTLVVKQVSRVSPLQPGKTSYEDYLPLPRQMQAMILQSTDVNCALEEIRLRNVQRGTSEWAPPRQQVIFQVQPYKDLKKQMQEQKYRCAGCRMEVEHSLAKYYRYCYYYGKYFCQNCHSNKKAVLPALVIREWNFKKKMVSNIAFGLLSEIEDIPHYNMSELNKEFYTRVVPMQTMLWLRRQLQLTRQYIATCRLASDLTVHYEELGHLVTDVHMYSLKDLIKMESGELQLLVRHLIDQSIEHVKSCDVCKFKGHYCEICQNGVDIIYPFEVRRVVQCPQCFACYHRGCFKKESDPCPKCVRLRAWKTKASVGQRPDLN